MGWEKRKGSSGRYYTRSRREGGRVVREYIGCGPVAEAIAALDVEERWLREEQDRRHREEVAAAEATDKDMKELAKLSDLLVEAEDTLCGDRVSREVDLVVLATGIVPADASTNIECDGDLQRDEHGFLTGDQPLAGLLAAGCAKRPMDVASSVRDATGAALKALQSCVKQS